MAVLVTLYVEKKEGSENPLCLQFASRSKAEKAQFALQREGYRVTGLYEPSTVLNYTPEAALATAKLFLR